MFFLVRKLFYFNRTEITISWCYIVTSKFQLYLFLIPRIQDTRKTFFFSYSARAVFPNGLFLKDMYTSLKFDYTANSGLFSNSFFALSSILLFTSTFADRYVQKGQESIYFGFCFNFRRKTNNNTQNKTQPTSVVSWKS